MLAEIKISVGPIHEGHLPYPGYSIFCNKTANGHTSPFSCSCSCDEGNTISDSLELQAEYPFIEMKDINKPMDSLFCFPDKVLHGRSMKVTIAVGSLILRLFFGLRICLCNAFLL